MSRWVEGLDRSSRGRISWLSRNWFVGVRDLGLNGQKGEGGRARAEKWGGTCLYLSYRFKTLGS